MKILFIQVEFLRFASSMPWPYHIHVGMAQALLQAGHQVEVVLTTQPALLMRLAEDGQYDLVIINDLVHGFTSTDPNCCRMPIPALRRLRERGVPMLGTIIEGIFHGPGDVVDDGHQLRRQHAIEHAAIWLEFMISYDRFDTGVLRDMGCRVLWAPFFSQSPPAPHPTDVSRSLRFLGAMYAKRIQFLSRAGVEGRIECGYMDHGTAFHDLFDRMVDTMGKPHADPRASMELVSKFKQGVFDIYARQLMRHALIINLPTIFKGIPCRLVEAFAMGRPSLSPRPRHADERALLALVPGRACLLYDDDKPETFGPMLDVAAEMVFTTDEQRELQAFVESSPFAPAVFAANIGDFIAGRREPAEIEASYLRTVPKSCLQHAI